MKLSLNYLFLAGLFFLNSCSSNVLVPESNLVTNKTIINKEDKIISSRPCTKEDLTGIWELHTQFCEFPKNGEPAETYRNSCKSKENISDFYYPSQLLIFNQDNDDRAAFTSSTLNKKSWDIKRTLEDLKISRMASKSAEQFVPKDQLVFKVREDGVLSNIPGFPPACLCTFMKRQYGETIGLQFFDKTPWFSDSSHPPAHMKFFDKVKNL
jgi:hypothetical protein